MTEQTFLFYDLETSGLSKTFAQVVEFAAIRTTIDLQEIEREHFYVKLTKDVVPEPDAFITHQLGLTKLTSGLPEHKAIERIHSMLNKPGTISLGYNTLGFDDEFLRFSFARCLLPPYTHQYMNNCGRVDLYPLVILYYLYSNSIMQWPDIDGKTSMKLEHIAAINNWLTGQAHHAMTDVEATLSLAKALAANADMWNFVLGYFNKQQDLERIRTYCHVVLQDQLPNAYQALLVWGKFGSSVDYIAPALCFGVHKVYKNQIIWLRLDKLELQSLAEDLVGLSSFVIRKKLGEAPIVLPWKNKYLQKVSDDVQKLVADNIAFLAKSHSLCEKIRDSVLTQEYPQLEGVDLDANLYQAKFPTREEQFLCQDFRSCLESKQDSSLLQAFLDEQQKRKAIRYVWRFYDQLLPEPYKDEMLNYWYKITDEAGSIYDFKGKHRTSPAAALARVKTLQDEDLMSQQVEILKQIEHYLKEHFNLIED
ncbi:MAG: exonuclease domain-containing protein [Pseudomonadota bacterium]|nr:exonuclease domain-containing protein [Pseudomonadota bacterium]